MHRTLSSTNGRRKGDYFLIVTLDFVTSYRSEIHCTLISELLVSRPQVKLKDQTQSVLCSVERRVILSAVTWVRGLFSCIEWSNSEEVQILNAFFSVR